MGKRGPAKTPTNTLKLRGSWRAKTRNGEPLPVDGTPQCPSWLRDDARLEWMELVPLLQGQGTLAMVDRNALARYCELLARWKELSKWLRENGETMTGAMGSKIKSPESGIVKELGEQLARLEGQFGMTPSARAGLTIDTSRDNKATGKSRHFA